jgi:ABC-type glycerol-3-phosphate transport system substrate-binding protein
MAHYSLQKLFLFLVLIWPFLSGCTLPTPPPSPTPWPTATTVSIALNPSATTEAIATSTPRSTTTPTATVTPVPTRATLLPPATPEPVLITVWENLPPGQAEQFAAEIAVFHEQFPQYWVEQRSYTNPEEFLAAVVSGQAQFDIVLASPGLLGGLWVADQLAPMSDLFPPSFLDSFVAVAVSGAMAEGQLWGLPETTGFQLMLFYNRSMVDTPPQTISELEEMANELAQDDEAGLVMNSYDPLWLIPWLAYYDGWLADEQGEPALNTPAMVEALTLYSGWFTELAPLTTYDEAFEQFVAGKAAMLISGDWTVPQLNAAGYMDWGVAVLPAFDDNQPVPLVLSTYWAVGRDTNQQQAVAAATFLEFVTQPQRQLTQTAKFGTIPGRREALDDPLIVTDSIRRINVRQLQTGRMLPLGVSANLILDAMRDPLRQVIDGSMTPEEAAAQMQMNLTPEN